MAVLRSEISNAIQQNYGIHLDSSDVEQVLMQEETILDEKTTIEKKKVELGKIITTEIVPKENITILNKKSDDQKNITYKTNINKIIAPVKKGDKVGTIDIIEDNNIISTIDATVKEDILKANILTIYLRNLKEIISGNLKI